MNNINIQFVCEPSKYIKVKDRDIWIDRYKELQILKRTVEVRDNQWIEKIVKEFEKSNKIDEVDYYEMEDVLIIKFYRTGVYAGEGETQEVCCAKFENIPENIQQVLRKFGVKDYYLRCDFTPDGKPEESMYETLCQFFS